MTANLGNITPDNWNIGTQVLSILSIGRRVIDRRPAAPAITSMSLALRDSSTPPAVIAPDATGTNAEGITVQSYREATFGRAHDVRITVPYTGASVTGVCTRHNPDAGDVDIPAITSDTAQFVFGALTQFTPEELNDYQVALSNAGGSDHRHIELQYWSRPTAALTYTSDTRPGSGGISFTEIYFTVTRTGQPKPTVSLTASDGSNVPNVTRAFASAEHAADERVDSVELQHISRAVTGTDRVVTYTFTVTNSVPGGDAPLTASAQQVITFP